MFDGPLGRYERDRENERDLTPEEERRLLLQVMFAVLLMLIAVAFVIALYFRIT